MKLHHHQSTGGGRLGILTRCHGCRTRASIRALSIFPGNPSLGGSLARCSILLGIWRWPFGTLHTSMLATCFLLCSGFFSMVILLCSLLRRSCLENRLRGDNLWNWLADLLCCKRVQIWEIIEISDYNPFRILLDCVTEIIGPAILGAGGFAIFRSVPVLGGAGVLGGAEVWVAFVSLHSELCVERRWYQL